MEFVKMHGAGNDYIYVDCTKQILKNPGALAARLSDRHFGIGADGMILIKPSEKADFFMEMYNADGSQGKMCGNGIRCVGKFVYDNGLTDRTTVDIDTLSGVKKLQLHLNDEGKVGSVTVDMGKPELRPDKVPIKTEFLCIPDGGGQALDAVISQPLEAGGKIYHVTCVSMGNPHAVICLEPGQDIEKLPVEELGPAFENHLAFPERVNTEFIQVVDRHNLKMRVWERGSGETLACGTGACASLVAMVLNGMCSESAVLHLLGGDLKVTWDRESGTVLMEGPAETVFKGEIEISSVEA